MSIAAAESGYIALWRNSSFCSAPQSWKPPFPSVLIQPPWCFKIRVQLTNWATINHSWQWFTLQEMTEAPFTWSHVSVASTRFKICYFLEENSHSVAFEFEFLSKFSVSNWFVFSFHVSSCHLSHFFSRCQSDVTMCMLMERRQEERAGWCSTSPTVFWVLSSRWVYGCRACPCSLTWPTLSSAR